MNRVRSIFVAPLRLGVLAGLAAMPLASPPAVAQCHYTYVQIPNPPGEFVQCRATSINNLGHVTGIIASLSENYRSFVWTPEGGRVDLPMPTGVTSLIAYDINDLGHVCGSMLGTGGLVAFLWDGDQYTIIDRPSWADGIAAGAINNFDQVVGTISNGVTGPQHAYVWHGGTFVDLGPSVSDTDSYGGDTNEFGLVAGSARGTMPMQWRSFLWDDSSVAWLPHPSPLDKTFVVEMSNNGFLAGEGNTEAPLQFFGVAWTPWGVEAVPAPPGFRDLVFSGVNDAGRLVGRYFRPIAGGSSGGTVVWQNGSMADLSTMIVPSPPPGLAARDINNAGQIAATFSEGTVILNPVWVPGDLTGDCRVSLEDLVIVLSNFGSPQGTFPRGDVDLDGDVDLSDLAIVLSHWGE